MDAGSFQRAKRLFLEAVSLDAAARAELLDRACADEPDLRREVERLLGQDDAAFTASDVAGAKTIVDRPGTGGQADPERIGAYRVLSRLGEGGFGVVYLAEQTEPVRRRVAVKIIKPGMDSDRVVARFEAERQALAMMDHPNIAKVLDAGVTDAALGSRPYFVMEHVPGEPITDYADRHRLSIRDRITLMVQVCGAIQHAHTKGIIHRDIKPSNVLVSVKEGQAPVPKVIDFGVAKALHQRLSAETVFTEQGQVIGTPEYMSPEQAEMGPLDIDTRSDVYSLGVLLYELLAGSRPFDLREAAVLEMARIIRDTDPPRPSSRLSSLGESSTAIAQQRRTTTQLLSRTLSAELEWIPLKALRKDRLERYQSAADLGEDLKNYLKGRPLQAGPESAVYRVKKFVRRHRGPVLAGGLVAAALTLGVVGLTIGLKRAWVAEGKQRRLAEANGQLASRNALLAESETHRAQEAETARAAEAEARAEALARAEEADRSAYAANILAASVLVASGRWGEARQRLDACSPALRGWDWGWLCGDTDVAVATILLAGRPRSVRWSPDGSTIAVACRDESWLYDATLLKAPRRLWAGSVFESDLSPDGKWIVAGSTDGSVRMLEVGGDGEGLLLQQRESLVRRVQWSPQGTSVLVTRFDGSIHVMHPGGQTESVTPDPGRIASASWSPDGSHLCVVSESGVRLFEVGRLSEPRVLVEGRVGGVAWSPDGTRLAVRHSDPRVSVFTTAGIAVTESGRLPNAYRQGFGDTLAWSPDGARVATAGSEGGVVVWQVGAATPPLVLAIEPDLPGASQATLSTLEWSPNGDWIAAGCTDGAIRLFAVGSDRSTRVLVGHTSRVETVSWSPDGTLLLTSASDQSMRLFAVSGADLGDVPTSTASISWSPSGTELAFSSFDRFQVLSADGVRELSEWRRSEQSGAVEVAWSGSDDWIAAVSIDADDARAFVSTIHLFASGELVDSVCLGSMGGPAEAALWSPDGEWLALSPAPRVGRTVFVWARGVPGSPPVSLEHQSEVLGVAWSPSDSRLATTTSMNEVSVWSPEGDLEWQRSLGSPRGRFETRLTSIAWRPDGTAIVVGGREGGVHVLSARGDAEPLELRTSTHHTVRSIAWSVRDLIAAYVGEQVCVWRPDQSLPVARFEHRPGLRSDVVWSPDGEWLSAVADDGALRLWSIADPERPLMVGERELGVWEAAWSPDGSRIAAASRSGVLLWDSVPASYRYRQRLLAEGKITRADLERAVAEGRLEQWEIDPLPWVLPIGEAAAWGGGTVPVPRPLDGLEPATHTP